MILISFVYSTRPYYTNHQILDFTYDFFLAECFLHFFNHQIRSYPCSKTQLKYSCQFGLTDIYIFLMILVIIH